MLNLYKIKKNNISNNNSKQGNILNEMKHSPSSTKEWYNSIYQYNKNNIRNLPSIDLNVIKLIRSYFNMFSLPLEKSIRLRKKAIWRRRFKLNKILIGKPEFKHTSDKVTIILYIYNRELSIIKSKIKKLKRKMFAKYFSEIIYTNNLFLNRINISKLLIKDIFRLKNRIRIYRLKILKKRFFFIKKKRIGIIKINNIDKRKKYIDFLRKSLYDLNKIISTKLLVKKNYRNLIIMSKSILSFTKRNIRRNKLNHNNIIINSIEFFLKRNNIFNPVLNKIKIPYFDITKLIFLKYFKNISMGLRFFLRYYRLMKFNVFKLNVFIKPLNIYLERIYKKNVIFNIINLKTYHLNTSILMQILATKLRNRKNRVTRVLPLILSRIKIPITRRLEYFNDITRDRYLQNVIIRKYLNKNFLGLNYFINTISLNNRIDIKKGDIDINKLSLLKTKDDKLDMIIKSINPTQNTLDINNFSIYKRKYKNIALDLIPNKTVSGIRVEASGRLSKRLIAARSVHYIRHIGTIRNINSSYKKISSVLLKGNLRSNVQFYKIKNKTRIGSFGLKGWIGSI